MVEHRTGAALVEADFPLGMLLLIIPNHACLAAACHDRYTVLDTVPRGPAAADVGACAVGATWTRCPERW